MKFKRVYIEITNICNLNCSFCKKSSRIPHEMSCEEFSAAISDVKRYSDYIYLHVKGEPLAHSEIDNILTICDNSGIYVNITTNGTLLSKNVNILKKHKSIRQINISLHCAEEPTVVRAYINEVLSSADILKKYFMISLRLWTCDNESISNRLIIDILKEKYRVDLIKRRSVLEDNIFLSLAQTFEWPSYSLPDYGDKGFCHGARDQLAILSNGDVVPCCLDADGEICFGNIFKGSLEQIFETERFKSFYNNMSGRKITEKLCRHCSYRLKF